MRPSLTAMLAPGSTVPTASAPISKRASFSKHAHNLLLDLAALGADVAGEGVKLQHLGLLPRLPQVLNGVDRAVEEDNLLHVDALFVDGIGLKGLHEQLRQLADHEGTAHLRRHHHGAILLQGGQVGHGVAAELEVLAEVELAAVLGVHHQLATEVLGAMVQALQGEGALAIRANGQIVAEDGGGLHLRRHLHGVDVAAIVDVARGGGGEPEGLEALLGGGDVDVVQLGALQQLGELAEGVDALGREPLLHLRGDEGGLQLDDLLVAQVDVHGPLR